MVFTNQPIQISNSFDDALVAFEAAVFRFSLLSFFEAAVVQIFLPLLNANFFIFFVSFNSRGCLQVFLVAFI